jgi:hypothetical protein
LHSSFCLACSNVVLHFYTYLYKLQALFTLANASLLGDLRV